MRKGYDTNMYYALVWSDVLAADKKLVIKGNRIHKTTKLPDDPRILYGAHPNDLLKITITVDCSEIKYDTVTCRESLHSYTKVEEYALPRDVCIVVWPRGDTLYTEFEDYRIVTPQVFGNIASEQSGIKEGRDLSENSFSFEDPKRKIRKDVLKVYHQY